MAKTLYAQTDIHCDGVVTPQGAEVTVNDFGDHGEELLAVGALAEHPPELQGNEPAIVAIAQRDARIKQLEAEIATLRANAPADAFVTQAVFTDAPGGPRTTEGGLVEDEQGDGLEEMHMDGEDGLNAMARDYEIEGRSSMNKEELIEAIRAYRAEHPEE